MKMEYVAEVVRGWPNDGALDKVETIKASTTLVNGDLVEIQSDGTVAKVGATLTNKAGLVVRGNGDSDAGLASNTAVVLWSNYVVRVSNASGSFAPGDTVTAANGVFTKTTAGTDPVIGHVIKVQAVSATETAHVVIVVK